ncbi:MAG: hypothetical protein ACK5LS_05010, partial [Propioniciclava sp.]
MARPETDADLTDDGDRDLEEHLPEISYDAQKYPSRPARLRPRARRRDASAVAPPPFEADGRNPAYVTWLVDQSMLGD